MQCDTSVEMYSGLRVLAFSLELRTGAAPNFAPFEASGAIVDRRPRLDLDQRGLDRTEHRGNQVAEPRPIELFTIHDGPHATRRQRDAEGNRRTARRYPLHPLPSGSPGFREHLSVLCRTSVKDAPTLDATVRNSLPTETQPVRNRRDALQMGRITGTHYAETLYKNAAQRRITQSTEPATGRRNRRGAPRTTVEAPDATQRRQRKPTTGKGGQPRERLLDATSGQLDTQTGPVPPRTTWERLLQEPLTRLVFRERGAIDRVIWATMRRNLVFAEVFSLTADEHIYPRPLHTSKINDLRFPRRSCILPPWVVDKILRWLRGASHSPSGHGNAGMK